MIQLVELPPDSIVSTPQTGVEPFPSVLTCLDVGLEASLNTTCPLEWACLPSSSIWNLVSPQGGGIF